MADEPNVLGSGRGDKRPHVIGDIDMHSPREEQFSTCVPCGVTVTVGDHLSLADAWAYHRGREVRVTVSRVARASDAEVTEFLSTVDQYLDDPWVQW